MPSSRKVLDRMDRRVAELLDDFEKHARRFNDSRRFTGPSFYFHRKALALRARHETVGALVGDDAFFDALYATLTAWGLHRMGPGNTRLRDLEDIRESIHAQAGALDLLAPRVITSIAEADIPRIVEEAWAVLTSLRVSVARAQIVANSKALHHILPGLVPPIDREYTYRFFFGRNTLSVGEPEAFRHMFSRMLRIAVSQASVIQALVGDGWHTSPAKVVDNAIVGYLIAGREP